MKVAVTVLVPSTIRRQHLSSSSRLCALLTSARSVLISAKFVVNPISEERKLSLEFSNNLPRVTKLVNATVRIQIFLRNGEMGWSKV